MRIEMTGIDWPRDLHSYVYLTKESLSLGLTTKSVSSFLVNENYRVPVFYILPKTHKKGKPPPGR